MKPCRSSQVGKREGKFEKEQNESKVVKVCGELVLREVCAFLTGLKLTHLTLPGRHSVTDTGLSFLARLSLLSELDLTDYTQVTDEGVSKLATMTRSFRCFF